jgi:hypothetical protein
MSGEANVKLVWSLRRNIPLCMDEKILVTYERTKLI